MSEFTHTQILVNVDISQVTESEARQRVEAVAAQIGALAENTTIKLQRHIDGIEVPEHNFLLLPAKLAVTPYPEIDPISKPLWSDTGYGYSYIYETHSEYPDGMTLPHKPQAVRLALKAVENVPSGKRETCVGDLYAWGYAGMAAADMIGVKGFSLILGGLQRMNLPALTSQVTSSQRKSIQDYLDRACA